MIFQLFSTGTSSDPPPVPILIEEVGEDDLRAHLLSDLVADLACATAPPAENVREDQNSRPRGARTLWPDLAKFAFGEGSLGFRV